jgi:hypothetical protein
MKNARTAAATRKTRRQERHGKLGDGWFNIESRASSLPMRIGGRRERRGSRAADPKHTTAVRGPAPAGSCRAVEHQAILEKTAFRVDR